MAGCGFARRVCLAARFRSEHERRPHQTVFKKGGYEPDLDAGCANGGTRE